jgi:membrane-associated protease RseP (regulator of RpoE activity)
VTWFYSRVRDELVGGGDPSGATGADAPVPRSRTIVGLGVVFALLAWLGMNNVWTLVFVLGLLVSVFLHEVGHFVTARLTGMKVTQFSMGFGPRLATWQRGEVEYGIRALPLGAYVRIIGMNNLDPVEPGEEQRAYRSKSFPRRLLVITAGSAMHAIIALALFAGVYATAGRWGEVGTLSIVGDPYLGSAAESIGVRDGDVIVSFDGTAISSADEFVAAVRSHRPGDRVDVVIDRNGETVAASVTLGAAPWTTPDRDPGDVAFFGVGSSSRAYTRQSPPEAAVWAVRDVASTAWSSIGGVLRVVNPVNIATNLTADTADPLTRPSTVVGASQLGGELGREEGWKGVLILLAAVNVFVGVFNLVPLLPFDGGHAMIAIYERVRSRRGRPYRADVSKLAPVATAVVALLVTLLVAGLYLDLTQPLG